MPAGRAGARRRRTCCAARSSSPPSSGVSIQYVIQAAGGEELNVFAQNTDGAEPEALAVGPRGAAGLAARAHVRGGPWLTRPAGASSSAAPGSLALASSLAGCGIEGTLERAAAAGHAGADDHAPEGADRRLDVLELAALHRQGRPQGVRQALRRPRQVRRGHQRQRRVLRQGPPAAAGRPADRARHRDPDRLHGRQVGAQPLRRAARQEEHAERGEQPRRQPEVGPLRQEARLHRPVAVGRGRARLQPEEDRPRAELGQRPLRPRVQGPRDDALRALRLGVDDAARDGRRPDDGQDRPDPGARSRRSSRPPTAASSAASPATTTRPIWPRATSGSRSPTPATSSSCRATTPI